MLQILESQLKIKQVQVDELQAQTGLLRDIDPTKEEEIMHKKARVEERYAIVSFLSTKFLGFLFSSLAISVVNGLRLLVSGCSVR